MSRKAKIIIIILSLLVIGLLVVYFTYLSKNNTFIKTNVKVNMLEVDGEIVDWATKGKDNWKLKLNTGKHVIIIYKTGYLPYFEIINASKLIPEFVNIKLTPAEELGSPIPLYAGTEDIAASVSSGSLINFPTLSADEKYIIYYNTATKEIAQFDPNSKDQNRSKTLLKLDFLNDLDNPNIRYSSNKNQALVSIWSVENKSPIFWLVSLDGKQKIKLNDKISNIKEVAISQDGKKIAVITSDDKSQSISLSSVDGANSQKILDIDKYSYGLTLSPDNKTMTYNTSTKDGIVINMVDVVSKKKIEIETTEKDTFFSRTPNWSPNNTQLAYLYKEDGIGLINKNGKVDKVSKGSKITNIFWSQDSKTYIDLSSKLSQKGKTFLTLKDSSGKTKKEIATLTQATDDIFLTKDSKNIFINSNGMFYKIAIK